MDEFLIPNAGFKRLWEEYHKYNGLIVCVDFDNTLYDFHKKGYSYPLLKKLVKDLYDIGCHIIIWTGNQDEQLVHDYCVEHEIPFHSINEDAPVALSLYKKNGEMPPRKIFANVYIDDRIFLEEAYKQLDLLLYFLNEIKYVDLKL